MELVKLYEIVLLLLLIACAVSVNLTKSLLQSVIIFMSYSSIMCLLWILMESPDLAITEAAVGAGVSGILFLVTLKKLRQMDAERAAMEQDGSTATAVSGGVPAADGSLKTAVPQSVDNTSGGNGTAGDTADGRGDRP